MANDPSLFEYSLKDITVAAVSLSGARFAFSDRINGLTDDPNGSASVGQGSGIFPRYHVGTTYEPTISLQLPVNEHAKFLKWFNLNCAADGVCHLEARRVKKRQAAVTDIAENWQPIRGSKEYGAGDATMVELSGNYLEPKEDTTNAIAL